MNLRYPALAILLPFAALTDYAVYQYGYLRFFEQQLHDAAGLQVLLDLIIALSLVMLWMFNNARSTGRKFWPWAITTLFLGSIGPLLYLVFAPKTAQGQALG